MVNTCLFEAKSFINFVSKVLMDNNQQIKFVPESKGPEEWHSGDWIVSTRV